MATFAQQTISKSLIAIRPFFFKKTMLLKRVFYQAKVLINGLLTKNWGSEITTMRLFNEMLMTSLPCPF